MTRRETFKLLLGVPALAYVALSSTVLPRDQSAYVQGLIDAGIPVPSGTYHLYKTLMLRGRRVHVEHSRFLAHMDMRAPAIDASGYWEGSFSYNFITRDRVDEMLKGAIG